MLPLCLSLCSQSLAPKAHGQAKIHVPLLMTAADTETLLLVHMVYTWHSKHKVWMHSHAEH